MTEYQNFMLRLHRRIPNWNLGMQHCLLHQGPQGKACPEEA